jgi:hypothetical protein
VQTPPDGFISQAEVIKALSADRVSPPFAALVAADVHRETLAPPLLKALEDGLENPAGASSGVASLFCHALLLLAKWRDRAAYPLVIRWLSLPDEGAFEISGDMASQGSRILASVWNGDAEPIRALIENRAANEYCRSAAIEALGVLAGWGELPREEVVSYCLALAKERLERAPSFVWNSLAADGRRSRSGGDSSPPARGLAAGLDRSRFH